MEQGPHHEVGLPADEVPLSVEREFLRNVMPEHGVSDELNERTTIRDPAAAAAQQVGELGDTASEREEQLPAGEAVTKRSDPLLESARQLLTNVYPDPKHHTVALLLDEATANMVIYAVRVLAAESEAHAREVRLVGATLPPDSYGAANRHAIASRHERIALRLRTLESSYRDEVTTARESLERICVRTT